MNHIPINVNNVFTLITCRCVCVWAAHSLICRAVLVTVYHVMVGIRISIMLTMSKIEQK